MIEASEEKVKDLPEGEWSTKINSDEHRKISEKPTHLAVHKEQKDILEILIQSEAIQEKLIETEKAQTAATHARELEKAREEGCKEASAQADENLRLLLSFLRNVSIRRAQASGGQAQNPTEEKAFETGLHLVYEGTDNSLTACHKLFNGVDEPVKEDSATCKLRPW